MVRKLTNFSDRIYDAIIGTDILEATDVKIDVEKGKIVMNRIESPFIWREIKYEEINTMKPP